MERKFPVRNFRKFGYKSRQVVLGHFPIDEKLVLISGNFQGRIQQERRTTQSNYRNFLKNGSHFRNSTISEFPGGFRTISPILTGNFLRSQFKDYSYKTICIFTYGYISNSAPRWLDSSVGRALHRCRRGHGFESRSGLNFFEALISQLLKLCVSNCDDKS